MSGLFRREALEKLQNPDRLDELLVVTGPRSWIAVAAISSLLVAATIWGIFGRVTTSVDGMGIFIRGGGLVRVVSVGSGTLWQLRAEPGSVVKEGEVVAVLSRPDLAARLRRSWPWSGTRGRFASGSPCRPSRRGASARAWRCG